MICIFFWNLIWRGIRGRMGCICRWYRWVRRLIYGRLRFSVCWFRLRGTRGFGRDTGWGLRGRRLLFRRGAWRGCAWTLGPPNLVGNWFSLRYTCGFWISRSQIWLMFSSRVWGSGGFMLGLWWVRGFSRRVRKIKGEGMIWWRFRSGGREEWTWSQRWWSWIRSIIRGWSKWRGSTSLWHWCWWRADRWGAHSRTSLCCWQIPLAQ